MATKLTKERSVGERVFSGQISWPKTKAAKSCQNTFLSQEQKRKMEHLPIGLHKEVALKNHRNIPAINWDPVLGLES